MIIKTKLSPISILATILIFLGLTTAIFMALPNSDISITGYSARPTAFVCGIGSDTVTTSIDFGCRGSKCNPPVGNCPQSMSPITDLVYAIIRFLSIGVGLVIVASMIYAGIQYIGSRGEPQATEHAMNRIRSNIIALILYIFTYAILDYVIPPGFFN